MKGRFWRKALAAAAALLIVSGGTPIKPVADLFGGMAITASAEEEYSGWCGDDATWSLDDAGKLTISGTGAMDDYEYKNGVVTSPWYSYADSITSVVIENGVTSIGNSAFDECAALTLVTIFDSVTSIGNSAFDTCTGLTSIEIPDSVTSIGIYAFSDCTSLTSVKMSKHVTSIGIYAFSDCTSLTSIKIPDSVTSIGNYVFSNCSKLTSITIPDSVTSIGELAFSDCTSLTSVKMSKTVTSIGQSAFDSCTGLTSIEIPDSVISIGIYAFSDCTSLTSIIIPDSVESIGDHAFSGCESLSSITIPVSVTSIGEEAFYDCKSLSSITIPVSVTSIGEKAFYGCESLSSITIPVSVESIGADAFYGCTGITDVYCYANPSKLTWNEFGCDDFKSGKETICHVPAEYLDDYNKNFGSTVNVTFADDLVYMGLGEHLYGYSVSLDGDIGVNFYMELDDSVIAHGDTAYIRFTTPKGSDTETKTVLVKDAVQKQLGDKTYYVFKCSVAAKDMASDITVQLVDGEQSGNKYTCSVKAYAYQLLAAPGRYFAEGKAEKGAAFVRAMLSYGSYAQKYFNEGTAFETSGSVEDVTIPDTFEYDGNASLPAGVTFAGATLSLKSETTLSLYFTGLPDNTVFSCEGKTVKTDKNGGYVVARIRGIRAEELKNNFTVTFGDDSVTYNAMTYCYNVLNGGSDDRNLQNVCKALYLYWQAAEDYSTQDTAEGGDTD